LVIAFSFLYIFLPVSLTILIANTPFLWLPFYLINILIVFYLFKTNSNRIYLLEYESQKIEEKFNILEDDNLKEIKDMAALQAKIIRYNNLKTSIEELNQSLDLDVITSSLASIAFSLISNNKGVCILYLIDKQLNLGIIKTRKEDNKLIIKAKKGDIFDLWVLRHNSPLLIVDAKNDFRFDTSASLGINGERTQAIDLEKSKDQELRPVSSLISSPLISEHRFFGTLRLDSPKANSFSQDDLRFLVKICDLGASALENSELFQRARNLAIHDSLTSLFTKGYFLERLREECLRAASLGSVFSLVLLDIDFFKNYNDRFGHAAGDIVLKNLSRNIIESLKDLSPIVSRFGGEEFCVILPGQDKKEACKAAGLLRERIENEGVILRRQKTNVTVSIGLATFPVDAASEGELIQKADKAMYRAKLEGRNRVCCIYPS
jgi:diguanylate cyclase (GGDEF)-like protein